MTMQFKAVPTLATLGDLANIHRRAAGENPLTPAVLYEGTKEGSGRSQLPGRIDQIESWVMARPWTATIIAFGIALAAGKLAGSRPIRRYGRRW